MGLNYHRLKTLRKNKGYTQEEVAERLGVSRQAIAKWEKGETIPDIESCITMADMYGVLLDNLVRGDIVPGNESDDGKHIFGISKINAKGQITIPVKARQVFNIKAGDNILILGDEKKGMAIINLGSLPDTISHIGKKLTGKDSEEEE